MMDPSETLPPTTPSAQVPESVEMSDPQSSSPRDDSFSMEDHQEAKKSRGGRPKLFQCTGYGDCRMVFTRSEHLARHMRKHTGEKPFKCVVPGCTRMFSRFDNMMQHTQTHNKSRATPRRPKGSGVGSGGGKAKDKMDTSRQSFSDADSSYDHNGLPSPPPSRRGSEHGKLVTDKTRLRHHRQLQRKNYAEHDEDELELEYNDSEDDQDQLHDDDSGADSDSDTNSYHMFHQHQDHGGGGGGSPSIIYQQRAMFAEMRRSSRDGYALPPPVPHQYSSSSYGWPKTMIEYDSIWPPPPHPPPSIQAPIPLIPDTSTSTSSQQHPIGYRQQRMSESPTSSSSSTSTTDSLPHNTSRRRPRTTPKVQFHPYPYNGKHRRHSTTGDNRYALRPLYPKEMQNGNSDDDDDDDDGADDDNDTRMILPKLATYLVAHPDEPPENYLLHHQIVYDSTPKNEQEPMIQRRALTWPTLPGTEKAITRRLSVQDLCNPIECLEPSSPSSSTTTTTGTIMDDRPTTLNSNDNNNDRMDSIKTMDNKSMANDDKAMTSTLTAPIKPEDGIDLTLDEYEAIQGFGRFRKFDALK